MTERQMETSLFFVYIMSKRAFTLHREIHQIEDESQGQNTLYSSCQQVQGKGQR